MCSLVFFLLLSHCEMQTACKNNHTIFQCYQMSWRHVQLNMQVYENHWNVKRNLPSSQPYYFKMSPKTYEIKHGILSNSLENIFSSHLIILHVFLLVTCRVVFPIFTLNLFPTFYFFFSLFLVNTGQLMSRVSFFRVRFQLVFVGFLFDFFDFRHFLSPWSFSVFFVFRFSHCSSSRLDKREMVDHSVGQSMTLIINKHSPKKEKFFQPKKKTIQLCSRNLFGWNVDEALCFLFYFLMRMKNDTGKIVDAKKQQPNVIDRFSDGH